MNPFVVIVFIVWQYVCSSVVVCVCLCYFPMFVNAPTILDFFLVWENVFKKMFSFYWLQQLILACYLIGFSSTLHCILYKMVSIGDISASIQGVIDIVPQTNTRYPVHDSGPFFVGFFQIFEKKKNVFFIFYLCKIVILTNPNNIFWKKKEKKIFQHKKKIIKKTSRQIKSLF